MADPSPSSEEAGLSRRMAGRGVVSPGRTVQTMALQRAVTERRGGRPARDVAA